MLVGTPVNNPNVNSTYKCKFTKRNSYLSRKAIKNDRRHEEFNCNSL